MATDQEIAEAIENAREEGALAERNRLRAFTGIPYVSVPDASLPEHKAYVPYERALTDEVANARDSLEETKRRLQRIEDQIDEAAAAHDEALQEHEQAHEKNAFTRLKGRLTENRLPEKKELDAYESQRSALQDRVFRQTESLHVLEDELRRVSAWLDDMFATTSTQGQARATDKEHAARDVTQRGFLRYRMDDFLEENPARKGSWRPDLPEGTLFGDHWRRDGDDDWHGGPRCGEWRCTWSSATGETFVWLAKKNRIREVWLLGDHIKTSEEALKLFSPLERRQNERNSLALVLDAYTNTYLRPGGGR
ncbi:hypothetical protein [Arthrobacter woluwensis]|uniref:Uncharacterized protein n=1 Tax=Arthrobacter woluwensis TaxID=156980 RepID=A0A1H4I7D0_9MICC|nr:hypothetical protein [Arthrobacter woluwensis]SEB29989.1 hypothetical protein SAMN04489745_0099 [Arthrobacter woluwensis]